MDQSASFYGSDKLLGSPLPPTYICHRCLQPGHLIKDCPIKKKSQTMKKATGIPRTFLKEIDDPNMTGAMLLKTGKYVIPIISAEAYAIKRKEKPQFPPIEPSSSPEEREQIPDKVVCLLCKDIMTDAAAVPCCANSFCDDCIRTTLLESEEHECPVCHQKGVSPNSIITNKLLRQFIENFNNKGQQGSTTDSPIDNYSEASLMKSSTVPPAPAPKLERASWSTSFCSKVNEYLRKIRTKERDYYSKSHFRYHYHRHRRSRDRSESYQRKTHKEEQDCTSRSRSRCHSPRFHHHFSDRSESYWRKIQTNKRDYYSRSRSRCHSPEYHRSIDRPESHRRKYPREEENYNSGSHSRCHSPGYHRSTHRSKSYQREVHREKQDYYSRSHSRYHSSGYPHSRDHSQVHREDQSYHRRSRSPFRSCGYRSSREQSSYRKPHHRSTTSSSRSSKKDKEKKRRKKSKQNSKDEAGNQVAEAKATGASK